MQCFTGIEIFGELDNVLQYSVTSELTLFFCSVSPGELISCSQIQLSRINGTLLGIGPKETVQGESSKKALSLGLFITLLFCKTVILDTT